MKKGQSVRRKGSLERLQKQMKSGVKTNKEGGKTPLTDTDKKRINREIEILETKLKKG